jgi:16S rRNA (guanine527-N7)-methyltransferase
MVNSPEAGAIKILKEGLPSLGITPSDDRIKCFSIYLTELKKWNKACNLTALRNDRDIVIKHFLDSLLYLNPIQEGFVRIADVGSGAGFPGIPMKIVRPDIELYLIEPSLKKAAFLRHISRLLHLKKIEVIEKRVEQVTVYEEIPTTVDVAMTRALFDIKEFVRQASHILNPGGVFILSKGPKVREEMNKTGDLRYEVLEIPLPFTDIIRYIIVVQTKSEASG